MPGPGTLRWPLQLGGTQSAEGQQGSTTVDPIAGPITASMASDPLSRLVYQNGQMDECQAPRGSARSVPNGNKTETELVAAVLFSHRGHRDHAPTQARSHHGPLGEAGRVPTARPSAPAIRAVTTSLLVTFAASRTARMRPRSRLVPQRALGPSLALKGMARQRWHDGVGHHGADDVGQSSAAATRRVRSRPAAAASATAPHRRERVRQPQALADGRFSRVPGFRAAGPLSRRAGRSLVGGGIERRLGSVLSDSSIIRRPPTPSMMVWWILMYSANRPSGNRRSDNWSTAAPTGPTGHRAVRTPTPTSRWDPNRASASPGGRGCEGRSHRPRCHAQMPAVSAPRGDADAAAGRHSARRRGCCGKAGRRSRRGPPANGERRDQYDADMHCAAESFAGEHQRIHRLQCVHCVDPLSSSPVNPAWVLVRGDGRADRRHEGARLSSVVT